METSGLIWSHMKDVVVVESRQHLDVNNWF